MKIKLSELRKIIRSIVKENASSSKTLVNETFQRITSKELAEWKKGNFDEIAEGDGESDPCERCNEMTPSKSLTKVKNDDKEEFLCQSCMSK